MCAGREQDNYGDHTTPPLLSLPSLPSPLLDSSAFSIFLSYTRVVPCADIGADSRERKGERRKEGERKRATEGGGGGKACKEEWKGRRKKSGKEKREKNGRLCEDPERHVAADVLEERLHGVLEDLFVEIELFGSFGRDLEGE